MGAEAAPDWLRNAVVEGVQMLHVLQLDGAPSGEVVTLTAVTWISAIGGAPVAWDEQRDLRRLQEAFVTLARVSDRWPTPKKVLEHLPPIPPPPMLPEPKADPARLRRELARLGDLREQILQREETRRRMARIAAMAARIDHPNPLSTPLQPAPMP